MRFKQHAKILLVLSVMSTSTVFGSESELVWKGYKNKKYQVEFQVPTCWKGEISVDGKGKRIEESNDIQFQESETCGGFLGNGSRRFLEVNITPYSKDVKKEGYLNYLRNKATATDPEVLYAKESHQDNAQSYLVAKDPGTKKIVWKVSHFCKNNLVQLTIQNPKPVSEDEFNKIKAGELVVPEIERKILNSFKCERESKSKSKKNKK